MNDISLCYTKFSSVCNCEPYGGAAYGVAEFLRHFKEALLTPATTPLGFFSMLNSYQGAFWAFYRSCPAAAGSFVRYGDSLRITLSDGSTWHIFEEDGQASFIHHSPDNDFGKKLRPEDFIIDFITDLRGVAIQL